MGAGEHVDGREVGGAVGVDDGVKLDVVGRVAVVDPADAHGERLSIGGARAHDERRERACVALHAVG